MTDLVACLGAGKGTWTNVIKLASKKEFENVFLIVNEWTKNNLEMERQNLNFILVTSEARTSVIRDLIVAQMKGRVRDLEVAVNMDSGTGKEHTAVVTALMRLGLALRFVTLEDDKIEEVSYDLGLPAEEYEI